MIVERFATSALVLHGPRTRPGVGQGPVNDPIFEQFVE